jgi:hypothetical protein
MILDLTILSSNERIQKNRGVLISKHKGFENSKSKSKAEEDETAVIKINLRKRSWS